MRQVLGQSLFRVSCTLAATLTLAAFGCKKADSADGAPHGQAERAAPGRANGPTERAPGASVQGALGSDAAPASADARPTKPLNVMLVLVDSMRADMPWAGYPRDIAPNLSALEKASVSYTRGYSVSSYTAKSVAALLSGKYPSALKRSGYFFTKYPDSNLFFPEVLQKSGVHTLSAHAHMYMKRGSGMDQGFDDWRVVDGITFDAQTDNFVTSNKLTPMIIEQLEKVPAGKPFFLYAHYMDPHDQYVKHKESPDFGNKARDKYDSEIFFTDQWIGKLFEYAKSKPWWGQTAIIVSADHGEAFGEHNIYRHAFELWDVLVHVPLFFHLPGGKARHIDTPRSAIDIAPSVLELMQVSAEHDFVGKSLVPELYGANPEPRPVLMDLPADSNNPERRALIQGDYKLLVFANDWRFDLYDLKTDPQELKNLAKTEPAKLEEMKTLYKQVWGQVKTVKPFGGNKLQGGGTASGPAQ